jgi:2-polyprenyl-3-methyl-5-hydroxy-6-metoxy-1,4-benzoquinol methylase
MAEKSADRMAKRQMKNARVMRREIVDLRGETAALHEELHERLLQYHLQLGRLAAVAGSPQDPPLASRVPLSTVGDHLHATQVLPAHEPAFVSNGTSDGWLKLASCPACHTPERTIVCEWNKLVLLDSAPDEAAWRYDYAVCHGCGIIYATRRPVGDRYRYLMDHFEAVIGKSKSSPLLNPHPLTEADRERYRRLISRGVFVSDHDRDGGEHIGGVLWDRLEKAEHVELLGSLLDLKGARVLEVRSRTGAILDGLRRHYGCEVYAMPIFESQQFIVQELYGIQTTPLIDFDRFHITHDEPFDLIVSNHMFNHAVRLDEFLAAARGALRPNGHLYLYNEIDDSELLGHLTGTSLISTLNPVHLQVGDQASLTRAVASAGFEPVFVKGRRGRNFWLMRRTEESVQISIPEAALKQRIDAYRRARDRAVLQAPEHLRPRFVDVWSETVERAVSSGVARFDGKGALRIVKAQG